MTQVVGATIPVLPYDETATHEGQIAAIAHAHQLMLVTFNRADYADFSDLMLEDWRV